MRIAVVTDATIINSHYRAYPLDGLRARGHAVGVLASMADATRCPPRDCDVAFVYRFNEPEALRLVRDLRDAGVAIVWDDDDDHTGGPAGFGMRKGALSSQSVRRQIAQMVRVADVVTTTSEVLAAQYRELGAASVRVVENYLPASFEAPRPAHEGVVVGWVATPDHRYDLRALGIREALLALLADHPEVRLESLGIDLGLPPERHRHTRRVEYLDLPSWLARLDVGIAPLADHPSNRARSNAKLKEYAAMEIPWLASPTGPYAGLGEREGGRLVPDDAWQRELDRLVRSPRDRRKLAKRGRRWAKGQRVERHLGAWEEALSEARERAGARAS